MKGAICFVHIYSMLEFFSRMANLTRACRVTEIEGIGERFHPKEPQVLFLG